MPHKYLYLTILLLSLTISSAGKAEAKSQGGAKTSISANIPAKVNIRIYGYTAPYSIVQASAIRVFAQVTSDKTGYFLIDPLPVSSEARELCLTTVDKEQRYGFPLCVSLPDTNKPTEIGPLLLSPTISLSSGEFIQGAAAQSQAAGQTLPQADVEISFFENTASKLSEKFIPVAQAKTIAKLTTKTDTNGNYSINLPANKAVAFRLFAKAFYTGLPTPKSQTLTYNVSSYTDWWLKNILPKLILSLLFLILLAYLAYEEVKTKRGRLYLLYLNETRVKPAGVRMRLTLRRIWYNFREYLRSRQK